MSSINCGCAPCTNGIAASYSIVVSGVTNGMCPTCDLFNRTYVLATQPFSCLASLGFGPICGNGFTWLLSFGLDANGKGLATLDLNSLGLRWTQSGLPDCMQVMTLSGPTGSNPICNNWPATIICTPIGVALNSMVAAGACIPPLALGCAPGSNIGACNLPTWGPPAAIRSRSPIANVAVGWAS